MDEPNKLKSMLVQYASSHQNKINVLLHFVGIPTIILGICIPLSWMKFNVVDISFTPAHIILLSLFLFYWTLDAIFAAVFLVLSFFINELAIFLGSSANAVTIASIAFFGGYILQFVGHAIEKSVPVLVKHPIQANIAAPFFVVVEVFGFLGLRKELFHEINLLIEQYEKKDSD